MQPCWQVHGCYCCPPPYAEFPAPIPARVTPRYVVLNTSADLVLEARFRGNFYAHEWVYNEDDPTFSTGHTSLFTPATVTNVGQTYTIPAGSADFRVGYYGPNVLQKPTSPSIRPTEVNTVIVGSFGKCTTTDSVPPFQWDSLRNSSLIRCSCSPYTYVRRVNT